MSELYPRAEGIPRAYRGRDSGLDAFSHTTDTLAPAFSFLFFIFAGVFMHPRVDADAFFPGLDRLGAAGIFVFARCM